MKEEFNQPEIDALKWKISSLEQDKMALADRALTFESESDRARKAYLEYEQENFLLKAENERLRKDAERYRFQDDHNFLWFPDTEQWRLLLPGRDFIGVADTYGAAIDAAMKYFSTQQPSALPDTKGE